MNPQQNSFHRKSFSVGYIYKIQNKVNGKVYIGQTIHPESRPFYHLENPEHTNQRFRSSIKHHEKENFEVSIICECYYKEDLDWAEIFYIVEWYDSTHPSRGYNLRKELQGSHHTQSLTSEEYKLFCDKMKVIQNNPEVIRKRNISLKITQNTLSWKENRKKLYLDPDMRRKLSTVQKISRAKPEIKEILRQGQLLRRSKMTKEEASRIGQKGAETWRNKPEEEKLNKREACRKNILKNLQDPNFLKKSHEKILEVRKTEPWKEKHKRAHNTESCKRKVREALLHLIYLNDLDLTGKILLSGRLLKQRFILWFSRILLRIKDFILFRVVEDVRDMVGNSPLYPFKPYRISLNGFVL